MIKKQEMKMMLRREESTRGADGVGLTTGSSRGGRRSSPFAQLLQDVKDFLWLLGQTVLAQLLQLPAGVNTESSVQVQASD